MNLTLSSGLKIQIKRYAPWALPGLIMLVLGLAFASRPVLSWDEIATADVAARTPGQIWHLIHNIDGVFGPYYYLQHWWTALAGSSELALRLPSILAMTGAVALTGELGRRMFGPAAGTVAGLLLCLMPNTSRYADEARPYAFACFFAVLALLVLHRAIERPSPRRWAGYGLAVFAIGLSHVIALTTLGAHVVMLWRTPVLRKAAVALGVGVVALAPIFWLGVHERNAQLAWVAPLSVHGVWNFPGLVVGSLPAAWLLLGLAVIALWQPTRKIVTIAVVALSPIAVVFLVSLLVAPYWVARYLLVVLPALALLASVGLCRIARLVPVADASSPEIDPLVRRRNAAAIARVCLVLAVLAVAVAPGQAQVRGRNSKSGSDYRTAASIIRERQRPGDAIVFTPKSRTMRTGLDYYLRSDAAAPDDVLLSVSAAGNATLRATEFTPSAARFASSDRIWLVLYKNYPNPTTVRRDMRPVLDGDFTLTTVWQLHKETLALYTRVPARSPAGVSALRSAGGRIVHRVAKKVHR